MPEKIATLARMIIFPNTFDPGCRAYIISAIDIDFEYYFADTDTESLHKDYWNKELSREQKVGSIQAMLNHLELAYGHRFRIISPFENDELDQFRQ
jgi:hypothetical protein